MPVWLTFRDGAWFAVAVWPSGELRALVGDADMRQVVRLCALEGLVCWPELGQVVAELVARFGSERPAPSSAALLEVVS